MTTPSLFAQQPEPVKVQQGLLQGTREGGLTVYKGVPFAAPPVGDLRWRPPQPAAPWEGVRQADRFGARAVQGRGGGSSEDCLYLNVWSPAKSADEKLPVLVWIHGGGFSMGATSEANYDGAKLANKGVVLVSIAYRLGQMGFFAHPELTAESDHHSSGNYGLLDMIAGLRWVQDNIAAMGGDPNQVTIFGESAGGIAVSELCASPLAKGLFQGAISQSGGSFGPSRPQTFPGENLKTLADAEKAGVAYAESAGAESIADLRKLSPEQLPQGRGLGSSWPIIDGWVIPDDQHRMYEAGNFNNVPILVGYNSDEGASFGGGQSSEQYVQSVKSRYGKFADALVKAYPAGEGPAPKTARDLTRDAAFGWHTWVWAKLQAEADGGAPAYLYYFDQHDARSEGSPHGQDVGFVFGRLNPNASESDRAISDAIMTYWTNFAKTGDPNGAGVPEWPRFTADNQQAMYFQQTPHPGPVPSAESLSVLDEYFRWRRSPEGEAWAREASE